MWRSLLDHNWHVKVKRIDMSDFEKIVAEEFDAIPEEWRARMSNVAILVEEHPPEGEDLLGLYTGVPVAERGEDFGMHLPDTITLFREPILRVAQEDAVDVRIVVRETLWHEIAHHFGFDEDMVERREDEGTNFFK